MTPTRRPVLAAVIGSLALMALPGAALAQT